MKKSAPQSGKAQERTEKRYSFNDYATELADSLMTMIPRAWEKPWRQAGHAPDGLALPYNATTGVEYKGSNTFRLLGEQMANGYSDPRWLTYRQAQELGGHVAKGQKGTTCVKWIFKDVEEDRPDGSKEKVERGFPSFFTLFNAQQCEGIPALPVREPVPESFRHEECERLLRECGAKITNDGGDRAYYRPSTDSIHLPTKEAFAAKGPGGADHYYSTAFHEVSHWTGALHRLNRDLSGKFGSVGYAKEELRAEIGSMLVAARMDIGRDPKHIANHHAYLKHWLIIAKSDPQEVVRACRDAEKICQFLNIPVPEHEPTMGRGVDNAAALAEANSPRQHSKAPALDQSLVERGALITGMHGVLVERFDPGSPQEALGKGWGYTGSTTFMHAAGGFGSREECLQHIAKTHGTSIQYQIPRNVDIGFFDHRTDTWVPFKVLDIIDDRTAVVIDQRNRDAPPGLAYVGELEARESGDPKSYNFKNVIRGIELAQQMGIRIRQEGNGGWQVSGADTHPILRQGFDSQLQTLDYLTTAIPVRTDRDLGMDLRTRLMSAYAFGSQDAGHAWESMVKQHGNEFDAIAQVGHSLRTGDGVVAQQWPTGVANAIRAVRKDNGLLWPKELEPALSL
ncbi:TPA: ArdC family protein [Stenotrophomonas maltophilia]